MTNRDRLLMYVARQEEDGCWQWNGQVSNSGMGRLLVRGPDGKMHMESAHRVSYRTFVGQIPDGMRVARTCGNSLCIKPEHLSLESID